MNKISGPCAIFIDIDGTLLGKNEEALLKNLATIRKVRSLGHKVFISTGRSTAYLPEELDYVKNFDGVITGAGAVVRIGEKEISKRLMPNDLIERFSLYIIEKNLKGFLEGQDNMYHFGFSDRAKTEWFEINNENLSDVLSLNVPIEKFTVLGDIPEDLDGIMGEDCTVLRFPKYGEIIQKSCGKGKALLDTVDALNIPARNSIAIGDSMNDYDMLKAAGFGVAMGNAPDEVKAVADMITDDVDSAGVSTALKKLFYL